MKDREQEFLIMLYIEFPLPLDIPSQIELNSGAISGFVCVCVCVYVFNRFKPAKQTLKNIPLCFEA